MKRSKKLCQSEAHLAARKLMLRAIESSLAIALTLSVLIVGVAHAADDGRFGTTSEASSRLRLTISALFELELQTDGSAGGLRSNTDSEDNDGSLCLRGNIDTDMFQMNANPFFSKNTSGAQSEFRLSLEDDSNSTDSFSREQDGSLTAPASVVPNCDTGESPMRFALKKLPGITKTVANIPQVLLVVLEPL